MSSKQEIDEKSMKKQTEVQKQLFTLQDIKYRDFHSRLVPGVDKESIIGVRTPMLRKFAKEFGKTKEAESFLQDLPHRYYEENNLHMMVISMDKDYESCLKKVEKFLPYINNWATCDLPLPKCFAKHKPELIEEIKKWIASGETYTIRYGIGALMSLYLDEDFRPEYLELAAGVQSEEYYVNMMIAWFLATALAKQWDAAIVWLETKKLPVWIHKKTIQKAIESYRITPEQKEYLRSLK